MYAEESCVLAGYRREVTGKKQVIRDGKTIITCTILTVGIVTKNGNNDAEKRVVEQGN
jgi:hypothetical protein